MHLLRRRQGWPPRIQEEKLAARDNRMDGEPRQQAEREMNKKVSKLAQISLKEIVVKGYLARAAWTIIS